MFLGHIGAALGAKRVAPGTSTALLLAAPLLPDLLWPVLLLLGIERVAIDPGNTVVTPLDFQHYPVTHSLAASVGWAVLAAAVYWTLTRRSRAAIVLGALVLSHWFFDLVVHAPDLPVLPAGPFVGLGAWNSLILTLVLEFGLLAVGVVLYQNASVPVSGGGRIALASLVGVLILIYLGNVFGPPPPDATTVAIFTLGLWLIPLWGIWLDRRRVTTRVE